MTLEHPVNSDNPSTSNYLIDRLKTILATTTRLNAIIYRPWLNDKRVEIYGDRKYYNQAFDLLTLGAFVTQLT